LIAYEQWNTPPAVALSINRNGGMVANSDYAPIPVKKGPQTSER